MEEPNTISDYTTITWTHASYLNLLDPLGKLECTGRFYNSRDLRVNCTNYRCPCITGRRGLQHPHQLGVPEQHMVTGAYLHQPTCRNKYCPGVLLLALGRVISQGGNHTSHRE